MQKRSELKICEISLFLQRLLTGIYLFKINNGNTTAMCETCSKLTVKILERDVIDVVLVFLLLTLNRFYKLLSRFQYWLWTSNCLLGYWQDQFIATIIIVQKIDSVVSFCLGPFRLLLYQIFSTPIFLPCSLALIHLFLCALRLVETSWLMETFVSECLNFN